MINFKKQFGLWRSVAIYYWKPFNRRRLKKFYQQFIKPGDLCFDLGAHLGNRADAWLHLGGKVVAVEPQPHCMSYMRRRFRNRSNITFVEKALGAEAGKTMMHISHMTPTVSTLSGEKWREIIDEDTSFKVNWEESIEVEMMTFDQLIDAYGVPAFCKLDVENYELEVLKGLSQPIPAISVEYYPATPEQAVACIDILDKLGPYSYNWSLGESQRLQSSDWVTSDEMKNFFRKMTRKDSYGDFYARLMD